MEHGTAYYLLVEPRGQDQITASGQSFPLLWYWLFTMSLENMSLVHMLTLLSNYITHQLLSEFQM